jgi:hypothetical protein
MDGCGSGHILINSIMVDVPLETQDRLDQCGDEPENQLLKCHQRKKKTDRNSILFESEP